MAVQRPCRASSWIIVVAAVVASALASANLGATAAAAAPADVVSVPVAFTVADTNTSGVPCPSDGAPYTVRGHLSGPRATLTSRRADAVTVYLFGEEAGEWNWHLTAIPAYDHASQMARLGQVSLTIDELGYGASGRPANGNLTCLGAEADVTHQIVQQLRRGTYASGTARRPSFDKVVLAGHDVGGEVAEIEAYSYADVDGLVLVTWADQGFTPWIIERETMAANDWCTLSADGYVHFVSSEEYRTLLFHDADPAVVAATDALRNPNPCGNIRSQPTGVAVDTVRVAQITVPVLVVYGDDDTLIWSRQGEEQQAGNFRGSPDATTAFIPDASHFPMFERTASTFRQVLATWLDTRLAKRGT
jgi:pimeloyl-ACP methyl ester carboxylesterase